jgi:hypothetical protein
MLPPAPQRAIYPHPSPPGLPAMPRRLRIHPDTRSMQQNMLGRRFFLSRGAGNASGSIIVWLCSPGRLTLPTGILTPILHNRERERQNLNNSENSDFSEIYK